MDRTTELLSSYATSFQFSDLPSVTVHESKRRIIDSLGCAMGGCLSEPARIAQRLAAMTTSIMPSRMLGSGGRTSPEMAAFANTTMVRYLDCNDTFVSSGSGHPSDMFPAALAVADSCGASGEDLIAATVLAYEVYGAFADPGRRRREKLGPGGLCGHRKRLRGGQDIGALVGADVPRHLTGRSPQPASKPDTSGGAVHVERLRYCRRSPQRSLCSLAGARRHGRSRRALRGSPRPIRPRDRTH